MTFHDWLFSNYPNPDVNGVWGWRHIVTFIVCIAVIIALTFIFKDKSKKSKEILLACLTSIILVFGIIRRVVRLIEAGGNLTFHQFLGIMLPRPWCAIACWMIVIAMLFRKQFLYNIASMYALVGAGAFFALPGVGFNNEYMLFENIYSIVTHCCSLVIPILMITLNFTKFEYRSIWKEGIVLASIFIYAIFEMLVLQISSDPMYFANGNDIQEVLGLPFYIYLPFYILALAVYFNVFYIIGDRKNVFARGKKNSKHT